MLLKLQAMKHLFIFLLFTSIAVSSQNSKITYSANLHNPKKSKADFIKTHTKNASYMKFELLFNKEKSYFKYIENLFIDNALDTTISTSPKLTRVLLGYYSPFYQNQKKQSYYTKLLDYQHYNVSQVKKTTNWIITEEQKNIKGYVCKKAYNKIFNKRSGKYITNYAWFTEEIPHSYGPIGFGGLPGVILEFHKGKSASYYAEKIIINSCTDIPLDLPQGQEISSDEMTKMMRMKRYRD